MLRRHVLKLPAFAGLFTLMASSGARAAALSRLAAFQQALGRKPWLMMVRSAPDRAMGAQATLEGQLPDGLRGTLFRNGPAGFEVGGFRYGHWFDGDGMVQAWRLTDHGVGHQARMIETTKYTAERVAGRALYPGLASAPPDPRPVTGPDTVNTGNISVLPHGDRLLALWEAGSPWEIDPDSLETRGRHTFSPATQGAPFSAHPRLETNGTLWNFGYASATRQLLLWHLNAAGRVLRTGLVPCDPMSMPHDFVVTRRHLVLLIPPLHHRPGPGSGTFLEAHRWHPDRPTRVLVVEKGDFSRYRWLELPAQWVFHFGNGWEDEQGVIRFDAARSEDPSLVMEGFAQMMSGGTTSGARARHHAYRLDTKRGRVSEAPLFEADLESEFPVIDPRVSCRRNHQLVMLTRRSGSAAEHPMLDTVTRFHERDGELTHFRYPEGVIPEEHVFVPAPGSEPETQGWIIGSALNYRAACSELRIFDAGALDAGPLAVARLPYALPLGLHGRFVNA